MRRGFTLLELLIVLVVIGLVAGVGIPRLERLSPKYSLRAAAREIASKLEYLRSTSIFQRKTFGMRYDLARATYSFILPPEEDAADKPFEEWPTTNAVRLPTLVSIKAVVLADNSVFEGDEIVDVMIEPLGVAGSHAVILQDTEGHILSAKFNALTGTVDFFGEEVGFARFD
jgi:prepilin-type N-terminal cleavage/methylation domain-containing protein